MSAVPALLAMLAAAVAASPAMGTQNGRPSIAVLQFVDRGSYGVAADDLQALEVGLQEMLITELQLNPYLQVLERHRVGRVERRDFGGEAEIAAAMRMGADVGALYVILGSFVDLHGDFRIDARIVNVETGETVRSERVLERRDAIYPMVVEVANGVTRGLAVPPLSRQLTVERETRRIPAEAVRLYSRGLLYGDRGDVTRARESFEEAKRIFPNYREVDGALRRLGR